MGAEALAQLRREMGASDPTRSAATQVLVAVPDRSVAGALTLPLTRLGHTIEMLDTPEEGGRLLEQGVFGIVITTRTAPVPGKTEMLYQRVTRLNPEARRRIFLILVGEDLKTADGTQAFILQADFVVHPKDAGSVEGALLNAMNERHRIYQAFLDARKRAEAATGY
jgi:DNA-binding NtrC family response regulator